MKDSEADEAFGERQEGFVDVAPSVESNAKSSKRTVIGLFRCARLRTPSEPFSLRWSDVDLDAGTAKTRAEENKGRKDSIAPLHPVIVELLRPLRSPHPMVFRWDLERKPLLDAFHKLQAAAGISLDCANPRKHECPPACQFYGFHDLRRAFATLNATRVSGEVLQSLMWHSSYQTTQRYINIAGQLQPKLADLFVSPALLPKNTRLTCDSDDAAAG